jgi:hypothetical protein
MTIAKTQESKLIGHDSKSRYLSMVNPFPLVKTKLRICRGGFFCSQLFGIYFYAVKPLKVCPS